MSRPSDCVNRDVTATIVGAFFLLGDEGGSELSRCFSTPGPEQNLGEATAVEQSVASWYSSEASSIAMFTPPKFRVWFRSRRTNSDFCLADVAPTSWSLLIFFHAGRSWSSQIYNLDRIDID